MAVSLETAEATSLLRIGVISTPPLEQDVPSKVLGTPSSVHLEPNLFAIYLSEEKIHKVHNRTALPCSAVNVPMVSIKLFLAFEVVHSLTPTDAEILSVSAKYTRLRDSEHTTRFGEILSSVAEGGSMLRSTIRSAAPSSA